MNTDWNALRTEDFRLLVRKFFEEIALLEQPYIRDEKKKIKDLVTGNGTIRN